MSVAHDRLMPPHHVADEHETVLDGRLLHMTREEAKAYLDEYMQERGLSRGDDGAEQNHRV